MQWYVYSIIAMVSFSAMMLTIRKIRDAGFSSMQANVFLFGFVLLGFGFLIGDELSQALESTNLWQALIFLAGASMCAIMANYADFKAVGLSPNPGYSQAIKNSNILSITIISVLVFNLSLDMPKIAGTLMIMAGICILVLFNQNSPKNEQRRENSRFPWYIYSFATVIFFTAMILILKKMTLTGFSSIQINFFLFGFSFLGFVALGYREARSAFGNAKFRMFLKLIFLASVFSLIGNYFDIEAIKLAPNPGYAQAIKNANVLMITMFSARFLSSEFSLRGIMGVAIVFTGIILLVV